MSTCRSCGAPVRWAVTAATGKRIPLDPDPSPAGNLVIVRHDPGPHGAVPVVLYSRPDLFGESDDADHYQSHFVTCPDAEDHRRAR